MAIEKLLSDSISVDSLKNSIQTIKVIAQFPEKSFLENIYLIATILIAIVNVSLIIYIFVKNSKKDENHNEKNRKIDLLKTLILNYNMDKFYIYFKDIKQTAQALNTQNLSNEQKSITNDKLSDLATVYRQDFIELFLAIDQTLYDKILEETDSLIDGLTNTIFDEGINLSHQPKFDELVIKKIRESKTEIIKILFSYSGE